MLSTKNLRYIKNYAEALANKVPGFSLSEAREIFSDNWSMFNSYYQLNLLMNTLYTSIQLYDQNNQYLLLASARKRMEKFKQKFQETTNILYRNIGKQEVDQIELTKLQEEFKNVEKGFNQFIEDYAKVNNITDVEGFKKYLDTLLYMEGDSKDE